MRFQAIVDGSVIGSFASEDAVKNAYPGAIAIPDFPVSRYFAIAQNEKRIINKGYDTKQDAAAAHPGCEVVSGFELRSIWVEWGGATIQTEKDARGGFRPGAGRKKSNQPDKRIKVSIDVYNEICLLQSDARRETQKSVSAKAIADTLILQANEGAIAPLVRGTHGTDKVIMRISQDAYERLQELVQSINEKSPLYEAHLGNVMGAIVQAYNASL